MSASPKLLWFSVPGLGPDDLVDKLRHCPNIAGLLSDAALGMMHMPGVALPQLFPAVAARRCSSFDLPWSPTLELDTPAHVLARALLEQHPNAVAVSSDPGPQISDRHRSLGQSAALAGNLSWALSQSCDLYLELLEAFKPELAFVELPGAYEACEQERWDLLELIDSVLGQVLRTASPDATVMITSPVGREWSRARVGLELALLRANVEIHAFGGLGQAALISCPRQLSEEFCARICKWTGLNQPTFYRARRRAFDKAPGFNLVQVDCMTAIHVTDGAEISVEDERFWCAHGLALVRDPAVRHGAFIQLAATDMLDTFAQLARPVAERRGGPLDPWLGQALGVGYLERMVQQRLQSAS